MTSDDYQVRRNVLAELDWDSCFGSREIGAAVKDAAMTLSGEIPGAAQGQAAQETVESVEGVNGVAGVTNRIVVRNLATAAGVKDQILDAFRRLARLDADRIQVLARAGTVTLHGEVSSVRERLQAANAAWQSAGVGQVIDNLTINPIPRDH